MNSKNKSRIYTESKNFNYLNHLKQNLSSKSASNSPDPASNSNTSISTLRSKILAKNFLTPASEKNNYIKTELSNSSLNISTNINPNKQIRLKTANNIQSSTKLLKLIEKPEKGKKW